MIFDIFDESGYTYSIQMTFHPTCKTNFTNWARICGMLIPNTAGEALWMEFIGNEMEFETTCTYNKHRASTGFVFSLCSTTLAYGYTRGFDFVWFELEVPSDVGFLEFGEEE